MTVKDLKLIAFSRRDALNNDLAQIKNKLNEIRIKIENRERTVKGLPQELIELQDKIAETNQRMTLTNSISDRLRFRRRIRRLTANFRELRQELNDQRVAMQREIKIRKKIKHEIFDITCNVFYYTCLVGCLDRTRPRTGTLSPRRALLSASKARLTPPLMSPMVTPSALLSQNLTLPKRPRTSASSIRRKLTKRLKRIASERILRCAKSRRRRLE